MLEEDKTRKQENHRSATKGQLLTDVLGVTCPSATKGSSLVAGALHRSQHEDYLSQQMKTDWRADGDLLVNTARLQSQARIRRIVARVDSYRQ